MATSGSAALAPFGQRRRGEPEVPGARVEVAGFTPGDRAVVRVAHPLVDHLDFDPTIA